jgi:hypothetical protein
VGSDENPVHHRSTESDAMGTNAPTRQSALEHRARPWSSDIFLLARRPHAQTLKGNVETGTHTIATPRCLLNHPLSHGSTYERTNLVHPR